MEAKYYEMEGVHKVFSVRDRGHHYYIQEMPGYWDCGRDYAVMKDRKRIYRGRFSSVQDAKRWLLKLLINELTAAELDL